MITADSNVFVYLYDNADAAKRATARRTTEALALMRAPIGLQVVGEVQNVLRRRLKLSGADATSAARNILELYRTFDPSREAAAEALTAAGQARLSYWDALLVASARRAGCTTLLSEDMADGALVLGVRIVNPFGAGGGMSAAGAALLAP